MADKLQACATDERRVHQPVIVTNGNGEARHCRARNIDMLFDYFKVRSVGRCRRQCDKKNRK